MHEKVMEKNIRKNYGDKILDEIEKSLVLYSGEITESQVSESIDAGLSRHDKKYFVKASAELKKRSAVTSELNFYVL